MVITVTYVLTDVNHVLLIMKYVHLVKMDINSMILMFVNHVQLDVTHVQETVWDSAQNAQMLPT